MRIENTGTVTGILAGFPARTPGAGAGGRRKAGIFARVELEVGGAREALMIRRSAVHRRGA